MMMQNSRCYVVLANKRGTLFTHKTTFKSVGKPTQFFDFQKAIVDNLPLLSGQRKPLLPAYRIKHDSL